MIKVYVDESGNLGREGRYIVLAAVVCKTDSSAARVGRIMKKACQKFAPDETRPLVEIKSTRLTFTQRQSLITKLVTLPDHELYILVADKRYVSFHTVEKNIVYNYLCGLLIKEIVQRYTDDIWLTFDSRSTRVTSRDSLSDYLKIKSNIEWGFNYSLAVVQSDSRSVYCLQAADLVANTIYQAHTNQRHHFTALLKPRIAQIILFPASKFGT